MQARKAYRWLVASLSLSLPNTVSRWVAKPRFVSRFQLQRSVRGFQDANQVPSAAHRLRNRIATHSVSWKPNEHRRDRTLRKASVNRYARYSNPFGLPKWTGDRATPAPSVIGPRLQPATAFVRLSLRIVGMQLRRHLESALRVPARVATRRAREYCQWLLGMLFGKS